MPVRLGDAEVDESGHRQTHVEPVAEAEVVDKLEDILHAQEDQTHQPLQAGESTEANSGVVVVWNTEVCVAREAVKTGLTLNNSAGTGV